MTTYYVDSAAGSNTAPYDTWAKAATLVATIAALDVAGDTVYVASTHSELTAGSITWGWAGTRTSPIRVVCADKTSGAPPVTIATGAVCAATNSVVMAAVNEEVYFYGITFESQTTGSSSIQPRGGSMFEQCTFLLSGASGSGAISLSSGCPIWLNCYIKFGFSGMSINSISNKFRWSGGGFLAGTSTPTTLVSGAISNASIILWDGLDFSQLGSSVNLFTVNSTSSRDSLVSLRNIKMPAAWSGTLTSGTLGDNATVDLINVDSSGTNYVLHKQTPFGDIYSETTIVRSNGASDGVTVLSWKMVSVAASGVFPFGSLVTGDFRRWNETIGSSVTLTVEFIHDSVTALKDDEIWLEVNYLGDSGSPLGSSITDAKTNVLASGTNQTSSAVTWTTTGLTNPNKQKLSVTFTPQLKGFFVARVYLCKASYTVYVDPLITVS